MSLASENPYAAPLAESLSAGGTIADSVDYKAILKRWELLRFLFNLCVGLAGAFPLAGMFAAGADHAFEQAVVYGLAANICYFAGPLAELYLNWLTDAAHQKGLPWLPSSIVRSIAPTAILFLLGTLASALITFVGGMASIPTK